MSIKETRQLGIEFERRVQTMIPEKEFVDKLDTETIYSFLNQYQDKYIHEIYRNLDQIQPGTKLSAHIESVLQFLLTAVEINADGNGSWTYGGQFPVEFSDGASVLDPNGVSIIDTARSITYVLPENFYMYVRSVSKVSSTFSYKGNPAAPQPMKILPNQLVSQNDVWRLIETPHDSLRILRYPAAVLDVKHENKPTITVIYDRYTTLEGIKVLYYKQPAHFSVLTSTPCELPMDAFDDLVTGAVDLYTNYVAGAEARKRQQDEARRQQAKEERQNNRNKRNDEE